MIAAPTPRYRNILVIKLGALGDFIQALGAMKAIRSHHKGAQITILTTAPFESLARDCGYFDRIIIDKKPKFYDLKGWMTLCNTLSGGKFERVYDLQNNDRTSFYLKILSPRPEWVGAAKGASHRNASKSRTAGHAFDGHKETLALAGIKNVQVDTLNWMKDNISYFALQPPYVLLVPGCAPSRPEKRWPAENYARLAKALAAMGYQPVILGTDSEKEIAAQIHKECPAALDLTAKTNLKHIATLARGAAGAIGNDTGPLHLIAASGCHSVALFSGHSDPVKHKPLGKDVKIVRRSDMRDIDVQDVLDALSPQETGQDAKPAVLH